MIVGFYDNDKKLGVGNPIYSLEVTESEYWFIEQEYDKRLLAEDAANIWPADPTAPPYPFFHVYYYEFVKDVIERKRASDKVDSLVKDL